MIEFKEFPKMPRLSREMIISEKIDGTNASIFIQDERLEDKAIGKDASIITTIDGLTIRTGSRTKWITPRDDNYGFSNWVFDNAKEIIKLGEGLHFGEWWGSGIQRGYNLPKGEKRLSLFNTSRWKDDEVRPKCCHVVPELYQGMFDTNIANEVLTKLKEEGSKASPGFMKPEGIIIFHIAGNFGMKKTIDKDEVPKSLAK